MVIEAVTENAVLLHDPDEIPFAWYEHDGHKELWPLESIHFKRWIGRTMYERYKKAPSKIILTDAMTVLAGKAI